MSQIPEIDEKELKLIRDALVKQEVNEKNINAIKDFAVQTREEFRELQAQVNGLKNTVQTQKYMIEESKKQMIQMRINQFSGGSTS